MLTPIIMTSGTIASHTGHSGRRLSCNMQSMTTRATGMVSRQSSSPPMSIHRSTASLDENAMVGQYHTWPKGVAPPEQQVNTAQRRQHCDDGIKHHKYRIFQYMFVHIVKRFSSNSVYKNSEISLITHLSPS